MVKATTPAADREEEQFLFYFRQHWIRLLWPSVRTALYSLVAAFIATVGMPALYARDDKARHVILVFLFVFILIVHCAFMIRFYRHFLQVTVVSDRRIHRTKKHLITLDTHESIDWNSIQEVHKVQRGVIQNIFGFGTLVLEAQETEMRLHFVPHIQRIYERITAARAGRPA